MANAPHSIHMRGRTAALCGVSDVQLSSDEPRLVTCIKCLRVLEVKLAFAIRGGDDEEYDEEAEEPFVVDETL